MNTNEKKFRELIHSMLAMAIDGNQALADIQDEETGKCLTIIIQPTGMTFDDADEVRMELEELVEPSVKKPKKEVH